MTWKSYCLALAAAGLSAAPNSQAQPTFLHEPSDISASVGANILFLSVAYGGGPIEYQWFKDGTAMSGATQDYLYLPGATMADVGNYSVVATMFSGSSTSGVAHLALDGTFTKITTGPLVNEPGSALGGLWGDYDNDGYPDVFVTKGGTDFNHLYHNNGNGTFTRVTAGAPTSDYASTVDATWADYDNDGWLDLFVVNSGTNALYHNNGDGTFSRALAGPWLGAELGNSQSAAWADYDRDGWLDLYVGNAPPGFFGGANNFLYRNNGNGTFAKITNAATLDANKNSTSVALGDFDNDGDPDFLAANATGGFGASGNEYLFRNNDDGSFTRLTNSPLVNAVGNSLSVVWVDYDNDLDLDAFVVNNNAENNGLFRNESGTNFTAITGGALVNAGAEGAISTACAWEDYDNDGWIDVFVTNDGGVNNYLYRNNGNGTFTKIESGSPPNDGGNSYGCAWVDYDRDGFPDLFVANVSGNNFLYRNNTNSHAWVNVSLQGRLSNRNGVGAKIKVRTSFGGVSHWQMREVAARDSMGSPSTLLAHFGLGEATLIQTLRIEWPSGITQEYEDVPVRRQLTFTEPPGILLTGGTPVLESEFTNRTILFFAQLSQPTNTPVTVEYFTVDGTATNGLDYVGTNGLVTFAPGQTNIAIPVTILGDELDETNETFFVVLTNSTVYPIATARARLTGTILDDDPLLVTVADASAPEGDSGTTSLTFTVTLSKTVPYPVSVEYFTGANGSARTNEDYLPTSGMLMFGPGQLTAPATVTVLSDLLDEIDETLFLLLTNPVGVVIVRTQATGTIIDNDPEPAISVNDITVVEGNSGLPTPIFTVSLSHTSTVTITVPFNVGTNGTATVNLDFAPRTGSVALVPGTRTNTFFFQLLPDLLVESNETVVVTLGTPSRGTLAKATGVCTILDDDFRVASVTRNGANLQFSFASAANRHYRVDWAPALSEAPAWTPLPGYLDIPGTGSFIVVTDPTTGPKRFYRIVQLP